MASEDEVLLNFEAEDKSTTDTTEKVVKAMQELDDTIKKATNSMSSFSGASDSLDKENKELESSTKKMTKTLNAYRVTAIGIGKTLKDWTLNAADAYGAQTRFNALFNKTNGELAEAQAWVDKWANSLYLDGIEVANVASKFRLMTQTMGINNEKSKEMTQNMTQLAYDLAAVTGHQDDVSTTMNAINSALAGQTKQLAKYGIALNNASLQETLNAAGINKKVSALTSAQKAELIYTQIMQQTAGMQGYYAKTLMSPANAANIVKTQFSLLAREIGNVFIPILMALVPLVIKVTNALRALAKAIAGFFGISINFDAYEDGFVGISAGIGDIGDQAEDTSGKVKNMIRDFDNLHVINFDTGSGSNTGAGGGIGGAGGGNLFDKQQYADWESMLDGVSEKLYWIRDIIAGIATGLALWKLGNKFLPDLFEAETLLGKISKFAGVLAIGIGIVTTFDGITTDDLRKEFLGALEVGLGVKLFTGSTALGIIGGAATLEIALTISMIKWGFENFDTLRQKFYGEVEKLDFGQIVNIFMSGIGKGFMDAAGKLFGIENFTDTVLQSWITKYAYIIVSVVDITRGFVTAMNQMMRGDFKGAFEETIPAITDKTMLLQDHISMLQQETKNSTDLMSADFQRLSRFVVADLKDIDDISQITSENIDIYLTEDLRQTLDVSETDWENYKTAVLKTNTNLAVDTKNNLEDMQTNIGNTDSAFDTATGNMSTYLSNIDKDMGTTSKNMISDMRTASEKYDGYSQSMKTSLENIGKADVKTPSFSWTENVGNAISGALASVLSALNLPLMLPKMMIDWVSVRRFATGGFPNKGELFIANERAPELIGSMGNRSVVANNTQITEGIAQASYNAFRQAFKEMGSSFGGDTLVYVGDTQITDVITKKKSIRDKRFGR